MIRRGSTAWHPVWGMYPRLFSLVVVACAIACGAPAPSFADGRAPGSVADYAPFSVELIASVRPRSETAPKLLRGLLETANELSALGAGQVDVVVGMHTGKRAMIAALFDMPRESSPGTLLADDGAAIWQKRAPDGPPPVVWEGKDGVVLQYVSGVWVYASPGIAQNVLMRAERSNHVPARLALGEDSVIEGWFLGQARGGAASQVVRVDEAQHLEQSWTRIDVHGKVVAHATYRDSAAAQRAERAGKERAAELQRRPQSGRRVSKQDRLALESFELSRSGRTLTYTMQLPVTSQHVPLRPAPCPIGSSFDGKRCVR